ncbi:hypothetical protein [Pontibacter chitinilyticus]|uniref:hypothetical protein n=1 Tax=Pontibacter chitinilyticus TaxID=2674989 RepID=UPI00321AAE16
MTAKELRTEIQKVLENVPESALEDVLFYLKEVQKETTSTHDNATLLQKILTEDRELLKKLAQ